LFIKLIFDVALIFTMYIIVVMIRLLLT